MRLRPLGDDFLDGCALNFEEHEDNYYTPATLDAGDPVGLLAAAASAASSVGRDLSIARRLRAAGLTVVEVDGWKRRGDAVHSPGGHVEHHTAGASAGDTPSLRICIEGRSDLSGPLCNTFLGRDRRWYVVASGRANHAGSGGWRGLVGNSRVHGTEVEHTGREPLPSDMVTLLAIGTAAIAEGRWDERLVCQHREWAAPAGTGKIDIAENFRDSGGPPPTANGFRSMVRRELRLLAAVERMKIVFPTGKRSRRGVWVRQSVTVPVGKVDEWFESHPGVKQRRGPGSGVEVRPV